MTDILRRLLLTLALGASIVAVVLPATGFVEVGRPDGELPVISLSDKAEKPIEQLLGVRDVDVSTTGIAIRPANGKPVTDGDVSRLLETAGRASGDSGASDVVKYTSIGAVISSILVGLARLVAVLQGR